MKLQSVTWQLRLVVEISASAGDNEHMAGPWMVEED
jgi:hypothetical protein